MGLLEYKNYAEQSGNLSQKVEAQVDSIAGYGQYNMTLIGTPVNSPVANKCIYWCSIRDLHVNNIQLK